MTNSSRRLLPLLLSAATLVAAAAHAAPSQPKHTQSKGGVAYRWVDEHGVVHYGDNIPPQYAAQERAVLNRDGIEVGHLDGQKTPEQAAADARTKADAL